MEINIEKALKITGWMTPNELTLLASIAKGCKKMIIEAGCFQGRSTRALADNMKESCSIHAIDPWDADIHNSFETRIVFKTDESTRQLFYTNLYKYIKAGRLTMHAKPFHEVFYYVEDIDFIFIDADHRYEQVKRDIEHALKFNPRIIGGHDYSPEWPGVIKAVDEIFGTGTGVQETTIWIKNLR